MLAFDDAVSVSDGDVGVAAVGGAFAAGAAAAAGVDGVVVGVAVDAASIVVQCVVRNCTMSVQRHPRANCANDPERMRCE